MVHDPMCSLGAPTFDLAVFYQSIKPRARLTVFTRVNQARNRSATQPFLPHHDFKQRGFDLACLYTLRGIIGSLNQSSLYCWMIFLSIIRLVRAVHSGLSRLSAYDLSRSFFIGAAILSFNSSQVTRAAATSALQFSICSKTRLASL